MFILFVENTLQMSYGKTRTSIQPYLNGYWTLEIQWIGERKCTKAHYGKINNSIGNKKKAFLGKHWILMQFLKTFLQKKNWTFCFRFVHSVQVVKEIYKGARITNYRLA